MICRKDRWRNDVELSARRLAGMGSFAYDPNNASIRRTCSPIVREHYRSESMSALCRYSSAVRKSPIASWTVRRRCHTPG